MGLTQSLSIQLLEFIKGDRVKELQTALEKNKIQQNEQLYNGRTGVILCVLYDSQKCLHYFIDKGNDLNIADPQDGNTPLIIASKFGFLKTVQLLIEHKALAEVLNLNGFDAFDMAFLRGYYDICHYFYTNNILSPKKTLENYIALNDTLQFPQFNIELFYQSLMNKTPINSVPSFHIEALEGKIPDPNETWGHFANRLWKMELFQPPLVDANSVVDENKKSLYLRMQTGLVEMEYDVDLDLQNKKKTQEIDQELNLENKYHVPKRNPDEKLTLNDNNMSKINNQSEYLSERINIKHDLIDSIHQQGSHSEHLRAYNDKIVLSNITEKKVIETKQHILFPKVNEQTNLKNE